MQNAAYPLIASPNLTTKPRLTEQLNANGSITLNTNLLIPSDYSSSFKFHDELGHVLICYKTVGWRYIIQWRGYQMDMFETTQVH